jgi:hypothetical protein
MNLNQVGADAIRPYLIQIHRFDHHPKPWVLSLGGIWDLSQNKSMHLETHQEKRFGNEIIMTISYETNGPITEYPIISSITQRTGKKKTETKGIQISIGRGVLHPPLPIEICVLHPPLPYEFCLCHPSLPFEFCLLRQPESVEIATSKSCRICKLLTVW